MRMMLSALVFGMTLTCVGQPLTSTKAERDSLTRIVEGLPDGSAKASALVALCRMYTVIDPEKAKQLGLNGLALARVTGHDTLKLSALASVGFVQNIIGEWPEALRINFEGLASSESYPKWKRWFMGGIALSYHKQQDYRRFISVSQQAFKLIEGSSEAERGHYAWPIHMMLAKAYAHLDNPDSGIYHGQQAFALVRYTEDPVQGEGFTHAAIAEPYLENGDFDMALSHLRQALVTFRKLGMGFAEQEALRDMARVFQRQGHADSAYRYAIEAFEKSSQIENPLVTKDVSLFLSEYFEKKDPLKSLAYLKEYQALSDSLYSIERTNQFKKIEFDESTKTAEIEKVHLANQSRIRQNTLLGSLTTVTVVALLLIYFNRQKQKANEVLAKQKAEIEEQNRLIKSTQAQLIQSEKMASLGELTAGIAHEIQNPLNFVNNFSEVSSELVAELNEEIEKGNAKDAKEIATDLKQNLEKINHHGKRAADIVKGMLQHSRSSTSQGELTDINVLCDEYLRLAFHGLRAKDKSFNAKFETNFDPSLPRMTVIPQDIGRVVLNLINNAFYAVSERLRQAQPEGGYEPRVTVSTKHLGNRIQISIRDNGTGIPGNVKEKIFQPFFTTKPTGQGTGLGLSLSYDIVRAHGGDLTVETKEGEGTTFIITLPHQ